ncbi:MULTISPECIES: hypothetical protein [Pseudonocardia]|uniref:Uncharacterized protein n=2 Tax=Pseudonocardia TaxID=1847 RepID=A0A1Y2N7S5_PSEAH|nr:MULTISPECIES: hypothetical protein [Pseudonocardia]OSY43525.1 hypothetical protein BG845_00468 [Pseudonocardia autotrophica]TDN73482.1 hypothetical protein C8E95_2581 [Pseudonocardia autotrophica]BBG04224.1 hypothetical protein Pdca_54330 [Pseudonocardia autotrophica]GEC29448.1 hypothetical protein PSA01_64770 [Pseudonocardia saturnea]
MARVWVDAERLPEPTAWVPWRPDDEGTVCVREHADRVDGVPRGEPGPVCRCVACR